MGPLNAALTVGLSVGVALGVGLGLSPGASAAPADPYPANLATYYSQTPAWTSCGTTSSSGTASAREQCAWITVPLGWGVYQSVQKSLPLFGITAVAK